MVPSGLKKLVRICLLILFTLAAACTLPSSSSPIVPETGLTPDAIYTAAVQTVIAQLTQSVANTPQVQPTQVSSATPQVQPTNTPVPTATPTLTSISATLTPTLTSTPTPTLAAEDPRVKLGNPGWVDTFENGDNWALYQDDHVDFYIEAGKLVMVAFNPDQWDGWVLTWPKASNFYLEMTATTKDCGGLDRWGLMFRAAQDASVGYLLGFTCDGRYTMRKWDGKKYTKYVDWTDSKFIHSGSNQTNRLGVMAEGNKFQLYANGNLLTEVKDGSYDSGNFGVYIGSAETTDFTVEVTEVAYWELE